MKKISKIILAFVVGMFLTSAVNIKATDVRRNQRKRSISCRYECRVSTI